MQVLAVSMTKLMVESYIEGIFRNSGEDTCNAEFNLAVNGPVLSKCDKIVIPALNTKFKSSKWGFF